MEFSVLGEVGNGFSRTLTSDFQRTGSGPFRILVGRVPWEAVLKVKEVQEDTEILKKEIPKA